MDGDQGRDEGIEHVETDANAAWRKAARSTVLNLPVGATFTTDYVWAQVGRLNFIDAPTEPRAMGAVMIGLARERYVLKTGRYFNTERAQAHGRPIPEWVRTSKQP